MTDVTVMLMLYKCIIFCMKQRTLYGVMALGGAIGVVAAFLQTLDKLALLKNKEAVLSCNLNSVFSCTNVLNSWQSSVFGFPNSVMSMVLFVVFTVAAVAGLTGGKLSKGFRLGVQFLSIFTLGFALWFLTQSTYVIGALCLLCMFLFTGLLLVNWAWLRLNLTDLPLSAQCKKKLSGVVAKGGDTLGWFILGMILAFAMLFRFW